MGGKHEPDSTGDGKWEGPIPPAEDPGGGGGKHAGGKDDGKDDGKKK